MKVLLYCRWHSLCHFNVFFPCTILIILDHDKNSFERVSHDDHNYSTSHQCCLVYCTVQGLGLSRALLKNKKKISFRIVHTLIKCNMSMSHWVSIGKRTEEKQDLHKTCSTETWEQSSIPLCRTRTNGKEERGKGVWTRTPGRAMGSHDQRRHCMIVHRLGSKVTEWKLVHVSLCHCSIP